MIDEQFLSRVYKSSFYWSLLALSYLLQPYRPRPMLNWARIRELLGFGHWITSSWFLIFIAYQGAEGPFGFKPAELDAAIRVELGREVRA